MNETSNLFIKIFNVITSRVYKFELQVITLVISRVENIYIMKISWKIETFSESNIVKVIYSLKKICNVNETFYTECEYF